MLLAAYCVVINPWAMDFEDYSNWNVEKQKQLWRLACFFFQCELSGLQIINPRKPFFVLFQSMPLKTLLFYASIIKTES
jgi:hypothetical protein